MFTIYVPTIACKFSTGEIIETPGGEDTPQTELPSSPCSEAHSHKYLRQESDVSERSFRPQASNSLTRIAIQEKLVTIIAITDNNYLAMCVI